MWKSTRGPCRPGRSQCFPALVAAGRHVSFVELASPFGHDAFLLDTPGLNEVVDGFLRAGEALL